MSEPPRVALVGMGGYAADHHLALQRLEERGVLRLVCTCDPNPLAHERLLAECRLSERAVAIYDDFTEMLEREASRVDLLTVATPIDQHRAMHTAGVERGLAVYLEKPPTLDPEALTAMMALDCRAQHRTMVGFNFILEPERRRLKERLLAGEFGRLRALSFLAVWPRAAGYFRRAPWAGRLLDDDGALLLDSCLGNATAHFSHNLLFWAGTAGLDSWAKPVEVEAQLYRAHDIEGADTFFVHGLTEAGAGLRIAVSHVGSLASRQQETVECERASIVYDAYGSVQVRWQNGNVEHIERGPYDPLLANYVDYVSYLSGDRARPHTTLEDSEPFVHLAALSYLSSQRIHAFPAPLVERVQRSDAARVPPQQPNDEDYFVRVRGLEQALDDFALGADFPRFSGDESHARRSVTGHQLAELAGCVARMASGIELR